MNRVKSGLALCLLAIPGLVAAQQKTTQINLADSTGMPGDNFSLEGALGLFKESKSVEDFEKKINNKDNAVNNLDLNGDGKTDYVRVVSDKKDNTHIFILQVPVTKSESQDIAVITVEKSGDKTAFIQVAGNEDIYGEEKIVEPKEADEPSDGGVNKKGPSAFSYGVQVVFVNVWFWPCVQYVYDPFYDPWISPWYWGYYPVWWTPWPPYPWQYHYMHCYHYHNYCQPAYYPRSVYGPAIYAPRRTSSVFVMHRYEANRTNYKSHARPRPAATQPSKHGNTGGQIKPSVKPGSIPTKHPVKPQAKPKTKADYQQQPSKPQTKPNNQHPQSKPQTHPQQQPQTKPEYHQPSHQQVKPAPAQPSRPHAPPASRPPSHVQSRPPH